VLKSENPERARAKSQSEARKSSMSSSSSPAVSPTTSLAKAAAAATTTTTPSNADEGRDVLSPLPNSSLARAAAAAVSKSGSSALVKSTRKSPRSATAGRRHGGGSAGKKKKMASHVRVVARIRPLSAAEISRGYEESVVPIQSADGDGAQDGDVNGIPFAPDEDVPSSPTIGGASTGSSNVINAAFNTPKIGNTSRTNVSSAEDTVIPTPETTCTSLSAGTDPAKAKQFEYDCVFPPDASQKTVYDLSVGDAVKRNIFRGFNTTVIAYGQTASGKTYTMDGPCPTQETIAEDEEMLSPTARPFVSPKARNLSPKRNSSKGRTPGGGIPRRQLSKSSLLNASGKILSDYDGIIPRAIHDLFETKKEQQREAKIHLSYLEIYNDSIRDLLGSDDTSSENLQLRDDGQGISIKGLSSMEVKTAVEAKELMDVASVRRTTGSTGSNARSSRSHAICILTVTINHGKRKRSKAKLTLVDLAGSERLKETGAEGLTKQEGIAINRDLFVLAKVVSALADRSKQGRRSSVTHIPYRDCKLTRILRDSLGGNCCTVMVACISPASVNLEESVNTLRYAQRAKAITNAVKQNVVARSLSSTESLAMQRENKHLKNQVADLMKTLNEIKASMLITTASDKEERRNAVEIEGTLVEEEKCKEPMDENKESLLQSDIFLETFNQDDGVDDDLLSVDVDDASSLCDFSIASSITMLDDSMTITDDFVDGEVAEKRELLERLDDESSKLQEQIDSLSKQVTATKEELQEASAQKLEAEANVKEMTATQQRIQFEMDSMKHQIRVLTNERKDLLDEIEERQELSAVIALLNEEQDARRRAEEKISSLRGKHVECDALRSKLTKIETDMVGLKNALECMAKENESLKKELREKENKKPCTKPNVERKSLSNNVLGEHNTNIVCKDQNAPPNVKKDGLESRSENSEHRAIRIHAAKMLWFANKSVEKRHNFGDMSAVSSIASNQSMDSANYVDSAENSLASIESSNTKSSKKSLKKKLGLSKLSRKSRRKNRLPPTGMPDSNVDVPARDAQVKETIEGSAIDSTVVAAAVTEGNENDICTCTSPIFGENAEEMEFYLPKLTNSLCTCGKVVQEDDLSIKGGDYFALENILRPWQVAFLSTQGITTVKDLVGLDNAQRENVCKAMKKYRKTIARSKPIKTQACGVALHVWIKTCSTALTNEKEGGPAMPNFLDISFCSRDDSISTIGNGSLHSGYSAKSQTRGITSAPPTSIRQIR